MHGIFRGCCPDHFNPQTGSCDVCHSCYCPELWTAHVEKRYAETNERFGYLDRKPVNLKPYVRTQKRTAPNPIMGDRLCLWCHSEFGHRRSTAEFCSSRCRVAHHREEKRKLRDCPRGDLQNGKLINHECWKEIALQRIYQDNRQRSEPST